MATKAKKEEKMYEICNGPSMLELMFSDYHLGGHTVEFSVHEIVGVYDGEVYRMMIRITDSPKEMQCQVIGGGRVERVMRDALRNQIPVTARLIRVRFNGIWLYEGWYDPKPRRGFLREVHEEAFK